MNSEFTIHHDDPPIVIANGIVRMVKPDFSEVAFDLDQLEKIAGEIIFIVEGRKAARRRRKLEEGRGLWVELKMNLLRLRSMLRILRSK